jgi:acetyl-CoA C-acetyltransferase
VSATFILGGAQTDFARNAARMGDDLAALMRCAGLRALEDASVDASEIEVGHVGNFAAELFAGQGHLGGFLGEIDAKLEGVPCSRHEGACASGSLAVLAAMADLEAGRYDVALVVGVELMRNVPGADAAKHLGAAAWVPRETDGVPWVWPAAFDRLAAEYDARFGLRREHLVALAKNAFSRAKKNPLAQTRGWAFTDASFAEDAEANPVVTGRIRRNDCSQITDGAAALVLATPRFADAWAKRRGLALDDVARITGWGHRTATMTLEKKLASSAGGPYVFPEVRRAITDALRRAELPDARALDAVECHDCFTPTAYMAIDHFALHAPGEAWRAIEDGTVLEGGALPFNPSGGLMGVGHPVGATGVRMLVDADKQVRGRAGDNQVAGARRVATLNIGGSATTTVVTIVARE